MSRARFNHARVNRRQQMRRQGVEDVREEAPFVAPLIRKKPRRPRKSKEQLRSEADRLVAEFMARKR